MKDSIKSVPPIHFSKSVTSTNTFLSNEEGDDKSFDQTYSLS